MSEHWYLPKLHRRSLFVLAALFVLINAIPFFLSQQDDTLLIETLESNESDSNVTTTKTLNPGTFDPNTAGAAELKAQGLSEYAIKNLIDYRSTGWRARNPQDLLKVYGVDSSIYKKIKDRIAIAEHNEMITSHRIKDDKRVVANTPFDPNTASFQELRNQGFSKYAANSLLAFLKSGARIQSKKDLKRIYGVDEALYESLEDRIVIVDEIENGEEDEIIALNSADIELPNFDPNTASVEDLIEQGLDRKTAYSLINYRGTGAVFKKKEQLLQIYGISDSLYATIESRIDINIDTTSIMNTDSSNADISEEIDTMVYNLNTITQEELLTIDGIGPYYSKAIIEYRSRLGGYYKTEQLLEVPAFREEHFDKLKNRFKVDGNITHISPVNEFKDLLKHPYIDYELAKKFKTMSVFDMDDRIQEMISTGQIEDRLTPYLQKY